MAALGSLSGGARSFYDDPLFSDVKITFNGQTFSGHKTIICRRSKFFEKALTGSFKEAQSGVVELGHDDDPHHIQAMLRYIYGLPLEEQNCIHDAKFFAHPFAMGDKYDIFDLRETATDKFDSLIKENNCEDPPTLYAIGYIVTRDWADKKLFNRALHFCAKNMEELIGVERFRNLLEEVPGFCAKLMVDVFENLGEIYDEDMIKCQDCYWTIEDNEEASCGCDSRSGILKASINGDSGRYWSRRRAGKPWEP